MIMVFWTLYKPANKRTGDINKIIFEIKCDPLGKRIKKTILNPGQGKADIRCLANDCHPDRGCSWSRQIWTLSKMRQAELLKEVQNNG